MKRDRQRLDGIEDGERVRKRRNGFEDGETGSTTARGVRNDGFEGFGDGSRVQRGEMGSNSRERSGD